MLRLLKGRALWLALLFTISLGAQAPPAPAILVTPGLVSASVGTSLYCALRLYDATRYQVYCYTSEASAWDTIVKNTLDTIPLIDASTGVSGGLNLPATAYYAINSTGPVSHHECSWTVWRDAVGFHWQVSMGGVTKTGTADSSGKFS